MMVETSVFAPHVRKHVETIMKYPPIGLCQKRIAFLNPRPSCPDYILDAKCDKMKLLIPYAGVPVECFVMFQASQPSCPPDFIFADTRFVVPLEKMSIFLNWDVHKTDGLYKAVKELMYFFKKKHISLLINYYDVYQEYLSLINPGNCTEDNIEIFVPSHKHIPISFLIRLCVDYSKLPAAYFKSEEDKKFPLLLVTFNPHDKNKRNQKIYFSSDLESALGLTANFKLPTQPPNLTLGQYVNILEVELSKKAEVVAAGYDLRKRYVATFVAHLESCVIEYDALFYRKLIFLFEEEDYHILVEISIPQDYPLNMPILTFRSLYHAYLGAPTSVVMNSYPFSSDWTFEQIFNETIKFIHDYASLFPQDSVPYQ